MIAALVLAFREGLEATLILGIVLGVLRRVGHRDQEKMVWLGAGLAVLLSLIAGIGLYALGIGFEGRSEEIFEGLAMLLAAGALTWMIFWMGKQGRQMEVKLEREVRRAARGGGSWAIFSLAFLAVLREGLELTLFLTAATFTAKAAATLIGGLLGLGLAVLAGWLILATTTQLDVRTFFRVTSILLLLFAAGLVAQGIHNLNEAGIVPDVVEHVWDTTWVLDEKPVGEQLLKALLGYNGSPSLTEVVAYVSYWFVVLLALRCRTRTELAATQA